MRLPVEDLTPRQIVAELDRYIVGQAAAKKAVAVALRNRYRRQQLPESVRDDILPKNILMMGPTGVGKTEIARRLAQLARAPFVKVEATKFTEVGYVGRDVDSMIRELAGAAVRLVERERIESVREEAESRTLDRILDLIDDEQPTQFGFARPAMDVFGFSVTPPDGDEEPEEEPEIDYAAEAERRQKLRERIANGEFDDQLIDIETEEPAGNPFVQVFSAQGVEEMGIDQLGGMGTRRASRSLTVAEARSVMFEDEAKRMIDKSSLHREAVLRTEQTGIIFLDEIDKVAGKSGGSGPDVSREGVQRDLLPVIEGSTVATKFGPVKTDHILFIAAGAFHMSKPSDLIPELQGRLPIRVVLEDLGVADFRRILKEPQNALTKQYELLLGTEGVKVSFTDEALDEIATLAKAVNERNENIGARRLHTMMEKLLEDPLFEAPDSGNQTIVVDAAYVQKHLGAMVRAGGELL